MDHREKVVDWWLAATAVFLTLLSVLVIVAGYVGIKRFNEIEAEARKNVKLAEGHAERAKDIINEIEAARDKARSIAKVTEEQINKNLDEGRWTAEGIHGSHKASEIERDAVELQRQGRFEEAIRKWRALAVTLEESDKDTAARAWFSVAHLSQEYRKDALDVAIDAYDEVIRLKPDAAVAYSNRGNAKSALGRHTEAIADHDKAIRLKSDYAEAYTNRGVAKYSIGRFEESVADHCRAIELNSDLVLAYSNRGNAKAALGRLEDAIRDYGAAIGRKPDYAAAYSNRGVAKHKLDRPKEAIEDHDRAIQLTPDFAGAYSNRGATKVLLGRHEEAIVDFKEAVRLARASGDEVLARSAEQIIAALPVRPP